MKMFYTMLVRENMTNVMEGLLNKFRIAMNDWDRTRVLHYGNVGYVNYTIICTEEVFKTIKQIITDRYV